MSIETCLNNAVEGGEISREAADRLQAEFEAYRAHYRSSGRPDADVQAKDALAERLEAEALEAERRTRLAAIAKQRVDQDLLAYRSPRGKADVGEAAIQLVEHFGSAPFSSVEGRRKAIIGRIHSRLDEMLMAFEREAVSGKVPKANMDAIGRSLFGEEISDQGAKAFADAWREVSEELRQRFNAAGGAIGKLENWGLPQRHDPLALKRAGRDAWKAQIRPRLDLHAMRHSVSDLPITEAEIDGILDEIFDTITTGGWNRREASMRPFGAGALAKQKADHRFLKFKSADDWMSYQRAFGEGDPFLAMMSHINLMARDIAAMEILGPNPNAMVEYLKQRITKEAALAAAGKDAAFVGRPARAVSRGNRKAKVLDGMWRTARGAAETPVTEGAAAVMSGTRNWITGSVMGSAILSAAPTDPVYQLLARRMAGIPVTSQVQDMVRSFGKGSRSQAVRSGLILDSAMHVFETESRYAGTLNGRGFTRYVADRVLTYSGLIPWTQAGRHSFGLGFIGAVTDHRRVAHADLPDALRNVMGRYGIGAEDWEILRKVTPGEGANGSKWLDPAQVGKANPQLADRYLEMILQETEYAVPSGTLRGRAAFISDAQPGTFWGEVIRSGVMFKSFAATFTILHGARIYRQIAASPAKGAAYAGAVLLTTTLGGMASLWLKDVVAGRDPRPMDGPDGNPTAFILASMMQGGGLGIFGDFLFADINRYGGGLATTLAGPVAERGTQLINLTAGNLIQLAAGEDTNFTSELRRFAGGMVPGSTIWYLRMGWQRMFLDQLEAIADPGAYGSFRRRAQFFEREHGNQHWWAPGEFLPDRAPDPAAALP